MITIFLIISRLNSGDAISCNSNSKKVVLNVYVEHHQQALTSASSYVKEITASSSYRNEFNSLSTSASVSGGFKGFSASASASYSEANSLIQARSDSFYREVGTKKTYNTNYLQISREVTTTVTIDGKSSKVFDKKYVDTTPTRWTTGRLTEESKRYLRNKFYGEDSKIRGTTYRAETCVEKVPCTPEQKTKKVFLKQRDVLLEQGKDATTHLEFLRKFLGGITTDCSS